MLIRFICIEALNCYYVVSKSAGIITKLSVELSPLSLSATLSRLTHNKRLGATATSNHAENTIFISLIRS